MKNFVLMAAAVVLGFTLQIGDAEAKRLGGGSSAGMQRQSVTPSAPLQVLPLPPPNPSAPGWARWLAWPPVSAWLHSLPISVSAKSWPT